MKIRRAKKEDIKRIIELLTQVLEIHAKIRPDIFVSGTTKYSEDDLDAMILDDERPIFVAADEDDTVMGYAFCQLKSPAFTSTMVPRKSIYIDDLCVDEKYRGQHVGEALFEHVKKEAKELGCYEVTLCVWNGNDSAERFYEKMGMTTKERVMEFILDERTLS